ncbi:uncharacterized protein LOC117893392 isoform X1 [Drosophila subobscura]|uniref:uncharacterized protein LOC117893392 isoform X1 n=1 Tax=Drosophila subobscura TaxID=7241 RepID=UPI00155B2997|nr:uncharacterized protein LOC117893392 isoform X1 [Drosophila subobscura]
MPGNQKIKKNVENNAGGARKKTATLSRSEFHQFVNNTAHRKTTREILAERLIVERESNTESSIHGRYTADSSRKLSNGVPKATQAPAKHANRQDPNGRDNESVSWKTEFQVAAKLKHSNTCHVPPEPLRNNDGLSEVRTKPSAVEAAPQSAPPYGVMCSEISERFPAPWHQSVPLLPRIACARGRGKQNKYHGTPQTPPNTWEREAAPGMYGKELANDCYRDIYRGISELRPEPSRQRPQAGTLAGGNRSIYYGESLRPPNNWRLRKPYVPPEAPMSMGKEYIGCEISEFFPVPPENPILGLTEGNTRCQRTEWNQNQPPHTWEREAAPGMYGKELANDCYRDIYRGISELRPEPSRQRPQAGTLAGGNRSIYYGESLRPPNNWRLRKPYVPPEAPMPMGKEYIGSEISEFFPVPPEHPILGLTDGNTSRQRTEWNQNQNPITWEREAAPGMYGKELANDCYRDIYRGMSEMRQEPSRQRPQTGTPEGGNRSIYYGESLRPPNNWRLRKPYVPPEAPIEAMPIGKEYIGSEISEFFPVPPEHPILGLTDGNTSRQRTEWNQNQNPITWEREAAPGMYGKELANDCYRDIYRGMSEMRQEPSRQRPQTGTPEGGNRNIYYEESLRPPNNWRLRKPYVPPEAPMPMGKEYIGSEISEFFPVPPEHPILGLTDGNTSGTPNSLAEHPILRFTEGNTGCQRTEWNQSQGVASDTDHSQIVFKNKWLVLAKAKESGPREVPIPWAQRVAEARREQKIQILKRSEPAEASFTIKDEPLQGVPRGEARVQSCRPIPTPARCVPKELQQVDRMTSADFRHDYAAHVLNMRTRLKNQEYVHYFEKVIRENAHLFKGRVILVLACGVGTLALMAARLGEAKRVYAVDHSMVTNYAALVVKQNHYEGTVKVLHGRVAELQLPEQVDGIVCNWMGQSLLWDSEILEVLEARDRWLKSDGFILPDLGDLYLLGAAEPELKGLCNWWVHVYGFNMSAMRQCALSEPRFAKTKCDGVLTLAHRVLKLDLMSATKEDLYIDREIRLEVIRDGHLECFTLYFDVAFSRCHRKRSLSCNPCLNKSHKSLWLQTALFVESAFVLRENHFYAGSFIFRPLKGKGIDMKQMEILIQLFVSQRPEGDMAACFGNRLVAKRWLMLDRHQTVAEVDSCQDAEY